METDLKNNLIQLDRLGITPDDARALRRISMTLNRWHELECGDGNDYGSWAIERDDNGDGTPFMVHHHYLHGKGKDYTTRRKIPDKEKGALRRLESILKAYPTLTPYVQGDPRGCALYLVRETDKIEGSTIDCYYSRGIAVY